MDKIRTFLKGHKQSFSPFFCALLLFVTILPMFIYNMSVSRQIIVVLSLALSMFYVMHLLKIKLEAIGKGMKYFIIACIIITVIWQVWKQLRWVRLGYPLVRWQFLFYYDKPFNVSVVLAVFFLLPTILRLFRKGEKDTLQWRERYSAFLKNALTAGAIIYIFILFFGFVLNRTSGLDVQFNFIPFKTMFKYIADKQHAYENTFLFMGNIAILLPFGFWFAIKNKKRRIILTILLPILASGLIELSQFLFKNGHVDIDDLILNVLGFYLGVRLKKGIDLVRKIVTKGEEKTIFDL